MKNQPEVWLRGQLPDIPRLLQPVAHALLQAKDEIEELMSGFPEKLLWEKPAGLASPAFHLQHITGVLDRLFTYAAGKQLDEAQLEFLQSEGVFRDLKADTLLQNLDLQIDRCIKILKTTAESDLKLEREVGRGRLPSTVIGLYVHAAEHTMRHTGQLLVTAKILIAGAL